ncbi:glucose 1-dehydrogenase [Inquilinus sp.]|jgi:3-oxoacyl-[acyl-carrier protein] reductase|uniref:glucose 1-dehydrogenase n=1 Tax=Inquilinus sp. TaxID=1932117 RepID=UPI0037842DF0
MRLEGKVAIVTGAASGFGKGIAERFVREGASVLIADLSAEAGEAVAVALNEVRPNAARFVRTDVSRDADTAVAIATAVEAFGGLDIVVNNAGYTHRNKPMAEVTEDEFDRIFSVNVKAIFLSVRHATPYLQAKGGSILNIASTAGLRPRPGLTWYNASKGAVITATKSMAVELAPTIRVNCLCPVLGQTGLTSTFLGDDTPERRAQFLATIPLGRMSTPEDIANAALYLSSDEASMVTGVALEVDGGRCI